MGSSRTPGYKYTIIGIALIIAGLAYAVYLVIGKKEIAVTAETVVSVGVAVIGALVWIAGELIEIRNLLTARIARLKRKEE